VSQAIALIVARAANGVIGRDGKLPWHIPADLKRFKALTLGSPMIMGRRTFDSLGRVLPGRRHIVLTRDPEWSRDGVEVAQDPQQALQAAGEGLVWVIGGSEVFDKFLPLAHRIELTEVHAEIVGDVAMPAPGPEWREVAREDHRAEGERPGFSFVTLERES
jgi:dihydrofolate reductase